MTRGIAVAVCIAVTAIAAGCGNDGSAETSGPATELRITRNFGHEVIATKDREPLQPRDTLLRQLSEDHEVRMDELRTYVSSIDGLRQAPLDAPDDKRTVWATNVNGVETDVFPPKYRIYDGDVVQWDLRDWYVTLDVRATVGAFPQTFTRGVFGKLFPVRVRCEKPSSNACRHVKRVLTDAGVPLDGPKIPRSQRPPPLNPQRARVLVGAWKHWREGGWSHRIDKGARYSGVFARFSPDSSSLRLLDWNAHRVRTEGAGTGLVAAMRPTEEDLLWLITGVDDEGVERAAQALDSDTLRDAFAVAVTADGVEKLPLVPKSEQ